MEDRLLVSIIINNYNYGRFLRQAIDSAINQTYSHSETIVVDDGSTDNSLEIIKSYGEQIIPVLKKNGGQASAFNAGFAASKGEIICFLDSDDIFLPEKIVEVIKVFNVHQEIGWCFHNLRLVDTNGSVLPERVDFQGSSQECDFRQVIVTKGKLRLKTPATSGLCFKRSFLQQILPMPEAERVSIGDHYLRFTSIALSKGFLLAEELALQRLHGENAYTLRDDQQQLKARIHILTAYWMRIKFPSLKKLTNNLFAVGVGNYWKVGGIEKEYRNIVRNYRSSASVRERIEINFRSLYHYVKKTKV